MTLYTMKWDEQLKTLNKSLFHILFWQCTPENVNSSKKVWKSEFDRSFLPILSNKRCMLAWYHQKDYLIFFKMTPNLLYDYAIRETAVF